MTGPRNMGVQERQLLQAPALSQTPPRPHPQDPLILVPHSLDPTMITVN